jgi:hypothetical protein
MFVEKAQWIDVLHGSRINGMATAVKYEKPPLFRCAYIIFIIIYSVSDFLEVPYIYMKEKKIN